MPRTFKSGEHVLTFEPEGHVYALDGRAIPSVTQVLEAEGFADVYKSFSREDRERFLFRGGWIHAIAALKVRDDFDPEDPAYLAHAQEFGGFVAALDDFLAEGEFKPIVAETPVCDVRRGYAGTPDLLGLWCGEPAVIDLKTGQVLELYTQLQAAAYAAALPWLAPDYELAGKRHRRIAIELHDDGTWRPVELRMPRAADYFLAALSLFNLKRNSGVSNGNGIDRGR